ncbi:MAG: two-component system response regulator RppA [Synechocystis sp.]|nr:two-component system response regulator RppA [Synechocystis sp.]
MRILLVEDEPDLGEAIRKTLGDRHYVVDWVQDGQSAWDYLQDESLTYTVVILDWLLPMLSGIEVLQKLRRSGSNLPVLLLTAKDSMADRVTGLDAGADDYLIKPFGMAELLARIRALQRRSPQLQPSQLEIGNLILDYGTSTVTQRIASDQDQVIPLTSKEFQLLEYFLQHPQQILSKEQLQTRLWSADHEGMSNVVAAQIRLLRRKLDAYGCANAIETIYGLGYRFNPDLLINNPP